MNRASDASLACRRCLSVCSKTVRLIAVPPVLSFRPKDAAARLGEDAYWECAAGGIPRPAIFWTLDSVGGNPVPATARVLLFAGERRGKFSANYAPSGHSVLVLQVQLMRSNESTPRRYSLRSNFMIPTHVQ